MKISDNFHLAFDALRCSPLRSFLTALGIIIGVMAVIITISIGEGAKIRTTEQIQSLGSNLLMVMRGMHSKKPLTNDLLSLIEGCPSIEKIAPDIGGNYTVSFMGKSMSANLTGTGENYPEIRNIALADGNFFSDRDVADAERVVVLGSKVADELFGGEDAIGKRVKIGRLKFVVIGVAASKGQTGPFSNDSVVYIPFTTAQRRLTGNNQLQMIYAQAANAALMDQAAFEVRQALLSELKDNNAFTISNQGDILNAAKETTGTMTLLLTGIAAVSLLVGGIGIMNIMLVSVTERIGEIGIRKALGAREKEILIQFMLEAATLSLSGGTVGVIMGLLGSIVMTKGFGWETAINFGSIVLAFSLSIAIGLFFGVYPANKAAQLDPIVALRHE